MIVFMAWRNNSVRGELTDAAETRFECMVFGGSFDECNSGFHMPEYTFWCLYVSLFCAALSTVVVTMHAKQIQRWIKICPCLKRVLAFSGKYCDCCDKDHVLARIVDGTYFNTGNYNGNVMSGKDKGISSQRSQRSQDAYDTSSYKGSGTNNLSKSSGEGTTPRTQEQEPEKEEDLNKGNKREKKNSKDGNMNYKTKTKVKNKIETREKDNETPIVINDGNDKLNEIEITGGTTNFEIS